MRKILFRGFHECENGTQIAVVNGKEYKGEWIVGAATYHSEGYQWLLVDDYTLTETLGTGSYAIIPETVGQFTGLKDKNGKKIFEGDIVVCRYANEYTPVFQNGIYMAYNPKETQMIQQPSTQFNIIWRNGCEVVGTIFDKEDTI